MRHLPLKYQVTLAPLVLIIPIIFVILLTLSYLQDIGKQNDTVRDWARATDHLQIAISAVHSLQDTVSLLGNNSTGDVDELEFDYLEQSRLLSESLQQPSLLDKTDSLTLQKMQNMARQVQHSQDIDLSSVSLTLSTLLPQLDYLYRSLQAQKRSIYLDSNADISKVTSRLANISISVLGFCVLLGVIIAFWINHSTSKRLKNLTYRAKNLCLQNDGENTGKKQSRDELDQLASCLSLISRRQLNLFATEKLLEGAEEERRRIAMDLHDQFLSDVTTITRELDELVQSESLSSRDKKQIDLCQSELHELTSKLRTIIDDLYPSSLRIFGLEAAIQAYLDRKITSNSKIAYYLSIDNNIDSLVNQHQCLNIYRIILELTHNILQHAHASRFEINLHRVGERLVLTVEDNGTGFDFQQGLLKSGHGLLNIEQRVIAIHGTSSWESSRFTSGSCFKLMLSVNTTLDNPDLLTKSNISVSNG